MIKLAHIADVHIRNLNRHSEYRIVISDFARQCAENGVDHIFVGGDVFHTKTAGMSPECIELMTWFFETLAAVCDVHVTLGNHDLNMMNKTRQDALTPIISALNNPRVHFYKKSGVYEFAPGFVWCVFSLADEEGWAEVVPVPGKINIACYHGPVSGAKTETDWLIDEGLTVDFFEGYDFAFLGDIHRVQFLGFRDVELEVDEAELSNYPGAEILGEVN